VELSEDYGRERVKNGWVTVSKDDAGEWGVSWEPDQGHADWPGHTVSPGDADYPGVDGPEALLRWGVERWGAN
jgi:hypothetical protein